MYRIAIKALNEWKKSPIRKPLLLRGARQVGKSYLVKQFGQTFDQFIEINFEKDKLAAKLFEDTLAADQLIQKIAAYTSKAIIPEKTLLFFDEVQECEQAILALRYFKEELPNLHVIAAGSLIDFKLKNIGMSVGRVQFLYLYPLSFEEYCQAIGCSALYEEAQQKIKLGTPLHEVLLEEVKRYFWLGGMPAVVDAWCQHKDYALCKDVQDEILLAYRQDFNKYAKDHEISHVERVFFHAGQQLGQKFKYATVDDSVRSNSLRNALDLLEMAGVIYRVYHSTAQGLPLAAGQDDRRFKVYFFDIGLVQRLLGVPMKEWLLKPLAINHIGSIAEQFVLQEYVAHTSIHTPPELFYWHREAKQSNAEVDFLFTAKGNIIPVEVKSGHSGRLRSLQLFLETHPQTPYGIKISESNASDFEKIKTVPFYSIATCCDDTSL